MNNLTIIDEREILGKQFRIYGDFENPLFLAKDVANWIEYDASKVGQMLKNIDENEYISSPIHYSGQVRNMYFLTEDGLYEVLMQSRKPIAKQFKTKVKEILKSIRKNGMYATEITLEKMIADPSFAIGLLTKLKEEQDERKRLEAKVIEQTPKVEYHDKVLQPSGLLTTTQVAKDLGLSARKLNETLNDLGVIYKQSNTWFFYDRYQNRIPEYADYSISEHGQLLKWTEKGRQWIIELLKETN